MLNKNNTRIINQSSNKFCNLPISTKYLLLTFDSFHPVINEIN